MVLICHLRTPVPCCPRLALPFGPSKVHEVKLSDANVIAPIIGLAALYHDAEDRMTPRRCLVHLRRPHRSVLFPSLN